MPVEEEGVILTCPICGSDNVIRVHPFDYVKQCNNDDCEYYKQNPEKYRNQWSTAFHN